MKPSGLKTKDLIDEFGVGVESECGKLDIVLMHRPGRELLRLNKTNLHYLLYDAIPDINQTHQSHDFFSQYLRDNGTNVLYLRDLLCETLSYSEKARFILTDGIINHSHFNESDQQSNRNALQQWLDERTPEQLTEDVIAGVTYAEFEFSSSEHSLTHLEVKDPDHDFVIPPLPNLLFMRDAFSIVEKNVFIWQMAKPARRNEPLLLRLIFQFHPYLSSCGLKLIDWQKKTNEDEEFPTIEGGDVAYIGQGVLMVGCSERTNRAGIEKLASTGHFRKVIAIMIPPKRDYMHLDTVLSSVGKHAFTLHGLIAETMEVFTVENQTMANDSFIKPSWISHGCNVREALRTLLNDPELNFYDAQDEKTSVQEQRECRHNVVVINNYHIMTYAGSDPEKGIVTQMTRDNICQVGQVPPQGLSEGGGGVHCMTNAIRRRAVK